MVSVTGTVRSVRCASSKAVLIGLAGVADLFAAGPDVTDKR